MTLYKQFLENPYKKPSSQEQYLVTIGKKYIETTKEKTSVVKNPVEGLLPTPAARSTPPSKEVREAYKQGLHDITCLEALERLYWQAPTALMPLVSERYWEVLKKKLPKINDLLELQEREEQSHGEHREYIRAQYIVIAKNKLSNLATIGQIRRFLNNIPFWAQEKLQCHMCESIA